MSIDLLVEGLIDEIVARRILVSLNLETGTVFGKRGCAYLRQKAYGISRRALSGQRVLILADEMDVEGECVSQKKARILSPVPAGCCVRLAVREVEAWMLASRGEIAVALGVAAAQIPENPDALIDPKRELVNIARRSRRSQIVRDLVPREGVGAPVGTGYVEFVDRFMNGSWDIDSARSVSSSLDRAVREIQSLK